jgi:signal transduction histidine kinase
MPRQLLSLPDLDPRALAPDSVVGRLGLFAALYAAFVYLGYGLREQSDALVIIWPASGFLFVYLFVTPRRSWWSLLIAQFTIELLMDLCRAPRFQLGWSALFAMADSVDAVVGALIAQQLIPKVAVPRVVQVLSFFLATCLGSATSALGGGLAAMRVLHDPSYLHQWQLWWAGNWLGALAVAPMTFNWAIRWRQRAHSIETRQLPEVLFTAVLLLLFTAWIFSRAAPDIETLLQMPAVILAMLVVAAFRYTPRWSTTLAALAICTGAFLSSRGSGPFFLGSNTFLNLGALQIYLATLSIVTYITTTMRWEQQEALNRLRISDERYRGFVAHSSEAVWRIEIDPPMPVETPASEQLGWLKANAQVAECNLAYRRMNASAEPSQGFRADVPWSSIYLEHLNVAATQGYSMDGLRFTMRRNSIDETYLASFGGVIEDGMLCRIWGVARDITELTDLTLRLRREQERIQAYARQLVVVEERARRQLADELRQGVERPLEQLSAELAKLTEIAPAGVSAILKGADVMSVAALSKLRELVGQVSPPRLFESGLVPALQWLAVYIRQHQALVVELQLGLTEQKLSVELRAAAYHIARELLNNVVRHAGVHSARLTVGESEGRLLIEVADAGRGFSWQFDLFADRPAGFGLFGVADRVQQMGGDVEVDTAPGRGCRVAVHMPLTAKLPAAVSTRLVSAEFSTPAFAGRPS